jgi:hypothetical protein
MGPPAIAFYARPSGIASAFITILQADSNSDFKLLNHRYPAAAAAAI